MRNASLLALSAITLVHLTAGVQAQTTAPDAGALLRESERPQRQLPKPAPQAAPQAPAAPSADAVRISVKAFKLTGNSLIAEPELQAVLLPWIGKESTFSELQQAANAIATEYRRRGWFVRPQLPAQDVSSGIITINIIEGKLGEVRIDDGGKELRIRRSIISDTMTARQQPGDPLNLDHLERSNSILNDTPGIAVATILSPGKKPGDSDAVVKVSDKPMLSGTGMLDNNGSRSTGENKLSISVSLDNPSGRGDQINLNGNHSQGSDYLKLGYSLPFSRDGLRVGINASALKYHLIGEDFAAAEVKGDAKTYGITANYPLLRSSTRNMGMAATFDRKDYYNEAQQAPVSEKQIYAGLISLTGDILDGFGAGGMTLWGVNVTLGEVDLSANATNQTSDRAGPDTEGSYQKLGGNLARLQRLSDKSTLWALITGQIASKNLDSSEKMALGGPSGVRAYPVMEGSGDEGWQATLESRYNLLPELQLIAFYDHGRIHRDHAAGYTGAQLPETATLKGYGIGASWNKPGKYTLRANLARRIGKNPLQNTVVGKDFGEDSDGSYDKNRLWLTGMLFF
jgi:hemolysin activation/secretion protein